MIISTCMKRQSCSDTVKIAVLFLTGLFSVASVAGSLLRLPEFIEPIKNVTLPLGSDVELSCDVRHLGTYRVTWSWKNGDEQKFLAIGIVKITHNQRVHISRIQKSDDVTQFNLYVYKLQKSDEGSYFCSVNSNPMIEQYGTLDITGDDTTEDSVNHHSTYNNGKVFNGKSRIALIKEDSTETTNSTETDFAVLISLNSTEASSSNASSTNSSDLSISQNEDSKVCIDLGEMWENARERLSEFLSALMKFTYSYWFR